MISYQHWFTLNIAHDYFPDNACSVFELSPMPDTLHVLKNFGIQFQKLKQEYHGYIQVRPSKKIWDELKTADDLYFQLLNTDQNFDNYTHVTLPKKEATLLYITNTKVTNSSRKEEIVTPKTNLDVYPLLFQLKTKKLETETIVIKNSKGEIIFNQTSVLDATAMSIDLRIHETGVYQLWINHTYSKSFFATSDRIHPLCYGIVHLQIATILESLKENTTPQLQVHFEARAAFWEYLVIIPEDKRIDVQQMTVESAHYSDPEKQVVLDNKTAYVFSSKQAMKLLQKPKEYTILKIQYTNHFSDTISELDIKMPIPSVASVTSKIKNNERLYYTQTILYV